MLIYGHVRAHDLYVGISDINTSFDAKEAALQAGMDLYLPLPVIGAFDSSNENYEFEDVLTGHKGTFQSAKIFGEKMERQSFHDMATTIAAFVFRKSFGVTVASISSEADAYTSLPDFFNSRGFPVVCGQGISLQGTIGQINEQMKFVYYYAPRGVRSGKVTMQVTAVDSPMACHGSVVIRNQTENCDIVQSKVK